MKEEKREKAKTKDEQKMGSGFRAYFFSSILTLSSKEGTKEKQVYTHTRVHVCTNCHSGHRMT